MEQDNKYYTPDLGELFVGYELESFDLIYGKSGEWRSNKIVCGTHIDNISRYPKEGRVRTKYLDQFDIESLGWKFTGGQMISNGRKDFKKGNWLLIFRTKDHTINLILTDDSPEEKYAITSGTYRGECKSINELRNIMKYLNIN